MALYYNNTSIPQGNHVYINNQDCQKVIYNNVEVWKRSKSFYPGSTPAAVVNFNSSWGTFWASVATAGTNYNTPNVYIPVDLTGISTLTVTATFRATGVESYTGCWLCNSAQFELYNQRYPYYTVGPGSEGKFYTILHRVVYNNSSSGVTWNVSNLSGIYYFCIGSYVNSIGSTCTAEAIISSIIGNY